MLPNYRSYYFISWDTETRRLHDCVNQSSHVSIFCPCISNPWGHCTAANIYIPLIS